MAEVIGVVAGIIQLAQVGYSVLKRLEEYQSKLGDIPESFRHIRVRLPVMLDALQHTQSAIEIGSIRDESKNALLPAIEGCRAQIKLLDDVVARALPYPSSSRFRRHVSAVKSFKYDAKVDKITAVIHEYSLTLAHHAAAASFGASPGMNPLRKS
jgi:hypothetical protein